MIALHQRANDFAHFLPAVNGNFASFTRKLIGPKQRPMPAGLTPRQLDFLDPDGLFYYPWALYTAAEGVGDKHATMVSDRDRTTSFVLGDSGGFSLISGAVKTPMKVFREQSLKYIEQACDAGLVLDVPTRAANSLPTIWNFQKCLDVTLENTRWAMANAKPETRLLAVYQGRNAREATAWMDQMKHHRLYGIAIGGHMRLDFHYWVKAIKFHIDDGYFDHIRHIHVLGTTEPGVAVLLTALKRALRVYLKRDDVEVTFDSSRAYRITQAYGRVTTGLKLGITGNSGSDNAFDFRSFTFPKMGGQVDRAQPFPFLSPLGGRCMVGDFLPSSSPADSAFDGLGSNMLSHHETFMELAAIEQANLLHDMDQKMRSLVPWHVQEGVRAIHRYFQTGHLTDLDMKRPLLQHYLKGMQADPDEAFR